MRVACPLPAWAECCSFSFTNVGYPTELCSPPANTRRCGRIPGRTGWWVEDHPWLLVFGKNMKLRGKCVRIIQSAGADKADSIASGSVGAPEGNFASRTAGNRLPHAARACDGDHFRLAGEELYAIGFDHRVHHTGRAGLALTPSAMTAVGE